MSDERKKPSWMFWTASALILVFVVYPLSMGPACWLYVRAGHPEYYDPLIQGAYAPLGPLEGILPIFDDYIGWWSNHAADARRKAHGGNWN